MNARRTAEPAGDLPILRKLRQCIDLTPDEIADLRSLGSPVRQSALRTNLVAEGQTDGSAVLLHEGWIIRHRTLHDGRRQILDFGIPGDLCDPSSFVTLHTDFWITAITPVKWTLVQPADVLALINRSPRLGAILWWLEAQEELLLRSHLVAVGRLRAIERIAYVLWELWTRLRAVGLVLDHSFEFPATQDMLADATGLSHVHVSRMLNQLEKDRVIQRRERLYRILAIERLMQIAQVGGQQGVRRLPRRIQSLLRTH